MIISTTSVRLLVEQIQLVTRWVAFLRAFGLAKHLKKQSFLESSHAQNLQDCVGTGLDLEALFDDGDEYADRNGNPDLDLDDVLGGAGACRCSRRKLADSPKYPFVTVS